MVYWLITIAVVALISGNLLLRAGLLAIKGDLVARHSPWTTVGTALRHWRVALGMLLVFLGAVTWIITAMLWQMEWSYIALGLSYVATVVLAWWFIGETLTLEKMLGAFIIMIGTLLIIRNSGF